MLLVQLTAPSTTAVAGDAGLYELGSGVRGGLPPRAGEAAILQVGAIEGLHLVDFAGEVHVAVHPRLGHHQVSLLVFQLVVIVGDAISWVRRGWGEGLVIEHSASNDRVTAVALLYTKN